MSNPRQPQVRKTGGAQDGTVMAPSRYVPGARPEVPSPWRPYLFKNLEKLSRTQALLTQRLEWLMPASAGQVAESIQTRMKELLEDEIGLVLDYVHVIRPGQMKKLVGEPTFLAVLSPAPQKTRGFLELELGLAHAAIDKLLGGAGETVGHRPLTDIEEGVMSFIILEALKTLAPNLDTGLPRMRLEGTARSVDEAMMMLGEENQVVVAQFKGTLGQHAGFVRLFIPSAIVGLTNPPQGGPERRTRLAQEVARNKGRLSSARAWLRAEIGRAEVMVADLAGLRAGDVVLVDEITARPDRGESGTARLRVGKGRAGWVDAELVLEGDRYKAKLNRFVLGEPPRIAAEPGQAADLQQAQPSPMESDEDSDGPQEVTNPEMHAPEREGQNMSENAEGVDLLNDVPLQVAVELGRIPITAEEVIALKVGQVVDLNRVPGEPVEMSVNGKVVARGELVELEGHLGVRILSLIG